MVGTERGRIGRKPAKALFFQVFPDWMTRQPMNNRILCELPKIPNLTCLGSIVGSSIATSVGPPLAARPVDVEISRLENVHRRHFGTPPCHLFHDRESGQVPGPGCSGRFHALGTAVRRSARKLLLHQGSGK
jgi:hypothetical protein